MVHCLTQSHTSILSLPWWGFSVPRHKVGFGSFPWRMNSPKTLKVPILCSLCCSTES
jgi:hypothetical protein